MSSDLKKKNNNIYIYKIVFEMKEAVKATTPPHNQQENLTNTISFTTFPYLLNRHLNRYPFINLMLFFSFSLTQVDGGRIFA